MNKLICVFMQREDRLFVGMLANSGSNYVTEWGAQGVSFGSTAWFPHLPTRAKGDFFWL